jgi:ATP-dependent Clp protease adapter protein ClpS
LATAIHFRGRAIVWSGSKEVAELKRDQIRSAGPDFHASTKVEFPLGVVIEPLPG